jgi:hypothetical protein
MQGLEFKHQDCQREWEREREEKKKEKGGRYSSTG